MPATAEVTALVPLPFNIPLSVVAPVPPAATFSVPPIVSVPDVVIAPPVNVNPVVPPDPDTEVTVPVLTDTDVFVTPVILPYASTDITGTNVLLPYVFAETPLVAKSIVIEPLDVMGLPLDVILPVVPLTVTEVTVPVPPDPLLADITLPFESTVIVA